MGHSWENKWDEGRTLKSQCDGGRALKTAVTEAEPVNNCDRGGACVPIVSEAEPVNNWCDRGIVGLMIGIFVAPLKLGWSNKGL